MLNNLALTLLNLKDYFFRQIEPTQSLFRQPQPFDSSLYKLGNSWKQNLEHELPGKEIIFYGSTKMKIPGERDIDLAVLCPTEQFGECLPVLTRLFGNPEIIKNNCLVWHQTQEEYKTNLDIVLVDPNSTLYLMFIRPSVIIGKDDELREQYLRLKNSHYRQNLQKFEFARNKMFNRVAIFQDPEIPLFRKFATLVNNLFTLFIFALSI
jgi:hypothetical protein